MRILSYSGYNRNCINHFEIKLLPVPTTCAVRIDMNTVRSFTSGFSKCQPLQQIIATPAILIMTTYLQYREKVWKSANWLMTGCQEMPERASFLFHLERLHGLPPLKLLANRFSLWFIDCHLLPRAAATIEQMVDGRCVRCKKVQCSSANLKVGSVFPCHPIPRSSLMAYSCTPTFISQIRLVLYSR